MNDISDEIADEMIKAFNLGVAAGRAEGAEHVEELMEEIKKLKNLGNEKLRWVTVPDEDQEFIGDKI